MNKLANIGRKVLVNCATVYMVDILVGVLWVLKEGCLQLQKDTAITCNNIVIYTYDAV